MQTYTVWGSTLTGVPFMVMRFHSIDARRRTALQVSVLNKISELQGYGIRYWSEPSINSPHAHTRGAEVDWGIKVEAGRSRN